MPKGFSTDTASWVYAPFNDAKNQTTVIPANPLPKMVPYSGPKKTDSVSSPTTDSADNTVNIEVVTSSVTVSVMRKK